MPQFSYDHHIGNIRTRRGESMNKATRMLVMTGMAIVAGVTFSAGPAAAASASPAPAAPKAGTQSTKDWGHDRSRIVGFYSNPFTCHRIGNFGERQGRWDDHACIRIPFGFHRGDWALKVYWDRHGFPGHGGPGFPGQWHDHDGPGNHHDGPGNHHGGPDWTKH
jgi:hypothetical protein